MRARTRNRAALLGLLACVTPPPLEAQAPPHEMAVFEAVIRQQLDEHLDAGARARGMVLCVGIDPGGAPQTPGKDFMARFRADRAVRRLAECERREAGAVEAMTLRPAVTVTAGPVDWRAADEAWVTVVYFRTKTESAVRKYRVVREDGGWVSLGPIMTDLPLRPEPPRE
ncbi:MAG TPA: hypothetical protein VLI67_07745 [Vicinamibacteria bacterium]|nr:hypothetical protein [Vicinamibacteria bacterium]